eukprot:365420-Chlamydomonas_euryale.AAC.4
MPYPHIVHVRAGCERSARYCNYHILCTSARVVNAPLTTATTTPSSASQPFMHVHLIHVYDFACAPARLAHHHAPPGSNMHFQASTAELLAMPMHMRMLLIPKTKRTVRRRESANLFLCETSAPLPHISCASGCNDQHTRIPCMHACKQRAGYTPTSPRNTYTQAIHACSMRLDHVLPPILLALWDSACPLSHNGTPCMPRPFHSTGLTNSLRHTLLHSLHAQLLHPALLLGPHVAIRRAEQVMVVEFRVAPQQRLEQLSTAPAGRRTAEEAAAA